MKKILKIILSIFKKKRVLSEQEKMLEKQAEELKKTFPKDISNPLL